MSIYQHFDAQLQQIRMPRRRDFVFYDVMNFRTGKYVHHNLTEAQLKQEGYKRPVFDNRTAEDGDLLIIISEKGEMKYQQAMDEYQVERDSIFSHFKKELFDSALSSTIDQVKETMFAKAWEDGHSGGLHDIEHYFEKYDDLVRDVLMIEGKKS